MTNILKKNAKCPPNVKTNLKLSFHWSEITHLHRAVNRQPGYPRETRKAKLNILQKVLRNVQKNIHLSL